MKICLVATFPPSGRQLNEYAFHLARELQRNPDVDLTILADELTDYEFATDADGNPWKPQECSELPGFHVIRCWRFGSVTTPLRILKAIRRLQPDVVWFNLVFSSFATPEKPICRICRAFCAGSGTGLRFLLSYHPAPYRRACRFCRSRRAPRAHRTHGL